MAKPLRLVLGRSPSGFKTLEAGDIQIETAPPKAIGNALKVAPQGLRVNHCSAPARR